MPFDRTFFRRIIETVTDLRAYKIAKKSAEWIFVLIILAEVVYRIFSDISGIDLWKKVEATNIIQAAEKAPIIGGFILFSKEYYSWILFSAVILLLAILRVRGAKISILSERLFDSEQKRAALDKFSQQYSGCEEPFRSLSTSNARRDYDIFHSLFADSSRYHTSVQGAQERIVAMKSAIAIIFNNITDVLNCAREVFTSISGVQCAACVQALSLEKNQKVDDAFVETVSRDSNSASFRSTMIEKYRIKDNDLNIRIYKNGESEIFIQDIAAEIDAGTIKTTSKGAGKIYRSVYILAVPSLDPTLNQVMATLCIDSENLMSPEHKKLYKHFATELGWRLSVMLYRLSSIQKELTRLGQVSTQETVANTGGGHERS